WRRTTSRASSGSTCWSASALRSRRSARPAGSSSLRSGSPRRDEASCASTACSRITSSRRTRTPATPEARRMRLLQLTAGTGSFHCGTCLRDAALVEELRRLGHDSLLAPLYLPLVLEEGVDTRAVRMGGINVWMAHASRLRLPRFVQDWLDSPRLLA